MTTSDETNTEPPINSYRQPTTTKSFSEHIVQPQLHNATENEGVNNIESTTPDSRSASTNTHDAPLVASAYNSNINIDQTMATTMMKVNKLVHDTTHEDHNNKLVHDTTHEDQNDGRNYNIATINSYCQPTTSIKTMATNHGAPIKSYCQSTT